jgi:hypothetical protein
VIAALFIDPKGVYPTLPKRLTHITPLAFAEVLVRLAEGSR